MTNDSASLRLRGEDFVLFLKFVSARSGLLIFDLEDGGSMPVRSCWMLDLGGLGRPVIAATLLLRAKIADEAALFFGGSLVVETPCL